MRPAVAPVWLLVALALAGCSLTRRGGPIPGGISPEQLLGTLDTRRASLTSLRARARLKAGLATIWTRQIVLAQRPGEVRMDVLSPFGLALAIGAERGELWAYSPSDQVRYEGEASPANLARFLGAPVSVVDLVDILMGLPPARAATGPPSFARDPDQHIVITIPFDGGTQRLRFDPLTLLLERAEERRGDVVTFTVAFSDYRDGFPYALDVASPLAGSSARLAYDTVEANPALEATLFAPPAAPRVLPLDAAAAPR